MNLLGTSELKIPGVKVLKIEKFKDDRGYFFESFRMSDVRKIAGFVDFNFKQSNESYSKKDVMRGMHFQWNPPMGKLVRTIRGHMVDIALDVRRYSPTYGKVIFYDMPDNKDSNFCEWIWLPPGLAHGNFFLEDTLIEYFCTNQYNPESEICISPLLNDVDFKLAYKPLVQVFTKLKDNAIISQKDRNGISLGEWGKDPNSNKLMYGII